MFTAEAIRRARDLEQEKAELDAELERLEMESLPAPEKPVYSFTPKEHPSIETKTDWKLALGPLAASIVLMLLCTVLALIEISFGGRFFITLGSLFTKLVPLAAVWAAIYLAFLNKKRQTKQRAQIETSQDYQAQCTAIDAENARAESEAKQAYEAAKKRYEEELLPNYEAQKATWGKKLAEDVAGVKQRLENIETELHSLYAKDAAIDTDLRNATDLDSIC